MSMQEIATNYAAALEREARAWRAYVTMDECSDTEQEQRQAELNEACDRTDELMHAMEAEGYREPKRR